jgi:putative mRNA 3-end processing factor
MTGPFLQRADAGLFCVPGGFHIDPWYPVDRAVITHAHADHARPGCGRYLAVEEGVRVLRTRLGPDAVIDTVRYGETVEHNGVCLSLHPAGHILGSAQVRMEHRGQVWVVSGDYKLEPDVTCAPFEPVRCHGFVTESTFGLPIYRWQPQAEVFGDLNGWWRANQSAGKASLLLGYALGKSQRLLAGVDPGIGPIFLHGAVAKLVKDYRNSGVLLPHAKYVGEAAPGTKWERALILAPPAAHGTPWARKFGPTDTGLASGWMCMRGACRRRGVDRGFVLSDHADWPALLEAIAATGAEMVWVTHGYAEVLARYLQERGVAAQALETEFQGEADVTAEEEAAVEGAGS